MKRIFDFSAALVLLVCLAPVFLAIAVGILVSEGTPVFFRQKRVGLGLRPFEILKFRTMRVQPASVSRASVSTLTNDVRITPIGRVLRKSSLDELPQLFNVLQGEMSLVGPRPDTPLQESDYPPEAWRERHQVRPGITGLAQVRGRSSLSAEARLSLDLQYVRTRSLLLDFRIMAETLGQVARLRGTN
jgi:lipopolysaccharide/colanic/teichoic acid biosynthesis glycosyltransferase